MCFQDDKKFSKFCVFQISQFIISKLHSIQVYEAYAQNTHKLKLHLMEPGFDLMFYVHCWLQAIVGLSAVDWWTSPSHWPSCLTSAWSNHKDKFYFLHKISPQNELMSHVIHICKSAKQGSLNALYLSLEVWCCMQCWQVFTFSLGLELVTFSLVENLNQCTK